MTVSTRLDICPLMRLSALAITTIVVTLIGIAGCGGDDLALCEGCEKPTATPTVTPSVTPTVAPSVTPTVT